MLRLQDLQIANFRGIREGSLTNFADVNILVGRNNSGKTTVLEAITRAMKPTNYPISSDEKHVDQFWSEIRGSGGDTSYRGLGGQIFFGATANDGRKFLPEIIQHNSFAWRVSIYTQRQAFSSLVEKLNWDSILSDRRDKILRNLINEVFDLNCEGFQLLPSGQFKVMFNDYSINLDTMGDGTRSAMRAFMSLIRVSDTLLLMEEPECHQHPGSLELFAKGLCKLAKERRVQLILTTHSQECIRAFSKATEVVGSSFAVYHLRLTDGLQESRRLERDAISSLDESGVDVRFADLYV
ncbi:MAG: AAA family ATPase [Fimbriiglobus sp.]